MNKGFAAVSRRFVNRTLCVAALAGSGLALTLTTGCARPNEIGYTPTLTAKEHYNAIARNWDNEGKMLSDDVDSVLLLRPQSQLTAWNLKQ